MASGRKVGALTSSTYHWMPPPTGSKSVGTCNLLTFSGNTDRIYVVMIQDVSPQDRDHTEDQQGSKLVLTTIT